ncbi:MAG: hypothetical protein ACSLE5_02070 [Porticoccaceae bacterium]
MPRARRTEPVFAPCAGRDGTTATASFESAFKAPSELPRLARRLGVAVTFELALEPCW